MNSNKCNFLVWKIHWRNVSYVNSFVNIRELCMIFKIDDNVFETLTIMKINVYAKHFFLSVNTSKTMLTYFLIVDGSTLNWLTICVALNPWTNWKIMMTTIFLIFNYGLVGFKRLDYQNGVNSKTRLLKASKFILSYNKKTLSFISSAVCHTLVSTKVPMCLYCLSSFHHKQGGCLLFTLTHNLGRKLKPIKLPFIFENTWRTLDLNVIKLPSVTNKEHWNEKTCPSEIGSMSKI
jgi:hypothetical protein